MNKKRFLMSCRKRLPTIYYVASVITGALALFKTGEATVKAVRKYDEFKSEGVAITPKVIIKKIVPYYIPAIGFATTSLTFGIASNTIHSKRNKALALAAAGATEALRDFKMKTSEVLGEDKLKEIEVSKAKDAPVLKSVVTHDSPIKIYDIDTGIKIESTYKKLYEAETAVNEQLVKPYCVQEISLKQFYRYLGADEKALDGYSSWIDKLWNSYYMWENCCEANWVSFEHEEVFDKDGTLMVMVKYDPCPVYRVRIENMV